MSDVRKSAVADSAIQVLLPLAELLLSVHMGVGDFVALAKLAFVQTAAEKTRKAGERKRANVSRIAVETGLTRNEVSAILKQKKSKPLPFRRGRARAERVLSGWWNDPEFLGNDGKPVPLTLLGPGPSMMALVQRHSGTARAQPIINELVRAGAIRLRDDGRYQAVKRSCVTITWDPASLAEFGLQVRTHLNALLQNLNDPKNEPQFARFFQSVPIDELQARVLLRDLKADGEVFLLGASNRLSNKLHAANPLTKRGAARRISLAVQVVEEIVDQTEAASRSQRPSRLHTNKNPETDRIAR